MHGRAIRFRRLTCMTGLRWSGRERSFCRTSSAATATPLAGRGGFAGLRSTAIASRMTEDQMIRQVLQGGGNMPAYGNALRPCGDDCACAFPYDAAGK